jgi:hypothetical protein
MEAVRTPSRQTTAIPSRYRDQRDRVLQILGRWEVAMRAATLPMTPQPSGSR